MLLWGLLAEEGEGDGGDDDFDAMAPLALLPLCCGSTARGYRSQLCVGGDPSGASSPRGTTSLTSDWQRVVALPVRGSGGIPTGEPPARVGGVGLPRGVLVLNCAVGGDMAGAADAWVNGLHWPHAQQVTDQEKV